MPTSEELLRVIQKQASTITNAKTEQTFTFKIPQTYHMETKSTSPRIDVEIHVKADTIDKTIIKENLMIVFNSLLETFS